MESRFLRAADGLQLHYLLHPCLRLDSASYCILLHGFTNDAHVWDPIAEELQQSHHVIALDHRGHGDSEWDPLARYSHWQLADDLLALIDAVLAAVPSASIHCVGHSLGARIALLALAQSARAVGSLTIIDAGPEVAPEAGERLVNDLLQLPEAYADIGAYREAMARVYVMADAAELARIAGFGLRMRRGQLRPKMDPAFAPGIWHKTPALQNQYRERGSLEEQLWAALRSIALPVHVLRGQASSILTAALATRMLDALGKNFRLSLVPRAGHAVMLDNPATSKKLITGFINSLPRKRVQAGVRPLQSVT